MSEDRRQEDRRKGVERRQGDRRQGDRRQKEKEDKAISMSLPLFITVIAIVAIVFITTLLIMVCCYEKLIKNLKEEDTGDVTEIVLPTENIDSFDVTNLTNDLDPSEPDNIIDNITSSE